MNKNFCTIDEGYRKDHIMSIIDLLYNECISAGGDGDGAWYSRFYNIQDIALLVREYNSKLKFPFNIKWIDENTLFWGEEQEAIIITNDEEKYKNWPDYIQMILKY